MAMHPLQRARLVDKVSHARERCAFYGRECWVAMKMGQTEQSYNYALLAFRFAVEAGFYREDA